MHIILAMSKQFDCLLTNELSILVLAHNVGVQTNHTFIVKTINYDYFKDDKRSKV
jgi:hypothetical protein